MKFVFLLAIWVSATTCYGLDAEAIRNLAKKPHSREGLLEELKIFPDAREYKVTMRKSIPGRRPQAGPELVAEEKVVDGKYLVTKYIADGNEVMTSVVTFDEGAYRKWRLVRDDLILESIGTAIVGSKDIAWMGKGPEEGQLSLAIESNEGKLIRSTELMLKDDKVWRVVDGTARVADRNEEVVDHSAGIKQLCQELVDALKRDDFVAYSQCWLSVRDMQYLLENPRVGERIPPKERHGELLNYFRARNQELAKVYRIIRKALLDLNTDLSGMKVIEVDARQQRAERPAVTMFDIKVQIDQENEVVFTIDDGALIDGRWYFTDQWIAYPGK